MSKKVLVLGLGEIGKPLMAILKEHYDVLGIDIEPVEFDGKCDVMHVCFPFQVPDFVGQCVAYINKYKPALTIINSTISPGTTRDIAERTGTAVACSPVRGKHIRMQQEMLHYVKFVGGIDPETSQRAVEHFESVGIKTKVLSSPEAIEFAKLSETTYFGLLIAWAQDLERFCDQLSVNYDEVVSYYEEIGYLPPVKFTPGIIGGHCVMPNIEILKKQFKSDFLDAIERSNELKKNREAIASKI